MRYLFEGIGYDVSRPSPLLLNNKSALPSPGVSSTLGYVRSSEPVSPPCALHQIRGALYACELPFITRMCPFVARDAWPKPVEEYGVLSYLGGNIIIAEGEGWRRQIDTR